MSSANQQVAVATTSQLAADAAQEIAEIGGNAVDCGLAAAMCSINSQPGVCALAGSAFITIWIDAEQPITIDGNVAIPGIGLDAGFEPVLDAVALDYGGGIETLVGSSSVAVPGTLAALYLASERYGRLSWKQIMQPSIRAAREGFPLAAACNYYLGYAGNVIYGRSAEGHSALHDDEGRLLGPGAQIHVPHLADTLEAIANEGESIFYRGEIGRRISEHVLSGGGMLTMSDLENYRPDVRPALMVEMGDWQIATNPPPAIGGANLAAMLLAFGTEAKSSWSDDQIKRLVKTQYAVMNYRHDHLDLADDVTGPAERMLDLARRGEMISAWTSASTVHTSAVDSDGSACAITASSGYGSGEMPAGTGIWLNNCLGEIELNRHGLDAGPPGKRLPSNMAPGAARSGDAVLAIGSPGADRITTALHQFLINFLQFGLPLKQAVAHPRMHLRLDRDSPDLAVEPGFKIPELDIGVTEFADINMYFGGVVAALARRGRSLEAAADPRREGGTCISP
jgi:gamma-glutamyltranspeptidase/glutathione hydrolase